MKEIFKGSAAALVTPFDNKGRVNFEEFKKLIDFNIVNGTKALVFLGTTGEPPTLSEQEKAAIVKFAVSFVNKRVPVIVGAGSNDTKHAVKMSKQYQSLCADALLCVTPYYNKCTQGGLLKHFNAIANSVDIPVIMYNVPGRTGVNMLPQTVKELAKHKNIAAIKEASGNIEQIMELKRICPDFAIYSGDDGLIYPVLALGGIGVISVLSNIMPKEVSELCEAYFEGDIQKSRAMQLKLLPLIKLLFVEVNPIPVKAALNIMGYNVGEVRLPLTPMEESNKAKLLEEMEKQNIKLKNK